MPAVCRGMLWDAPMSDRPAGEETIVRRGRRRRRTRTARSVLGVLVALALVAALVVAGSGWYFAGELHRQALAVDPDSSQRRPDLDLTVARSGDGQVELTGTPDAGSLGLADDEGTWGLQWVGGAGVLGGAPQRTADGGVRRTLEVTAGTAPGRGATAGVVADVWSDPAAAYGAAYEDVVYPCAGATCPAWFVPAAGAAEAAVGPAQVGGGDTWAVMVHGKDASRTEALRALGPVHEAGMPALLIGYRGDPGTPNPQGRHAYGATEWRDLDAAVRWAGERGARRAVLFGSSMGGAVVASSLQRATAAGSSGAVRVGGVEVVGVVLDSPALDLGASVRQGADALGLPGFAAPVARQMASWRYGMDFDAVDYLPGAWVSVPVLVFHGTSDGTVPVAVSDGLAAAHPGLVREVRVAGAGHVQSWNVDPQAYRVQESRFLARVAEG